MNKSKLIIKLINRGFPLRFMLARLTNVPLIGDFMDRLFFDEDSMIYLPKDNLVEIELNRSIDMPDNIVVPSEIVEHFIREADFHWIMDFCICRKTEGCDDYPIDLGCLFLGEAAKDIDPDLGRPVSEKEALEHVKKCREAGLVHLIGRNKLDPLWLDVRPGEKLLTVCNCCPCCCLWKMLPDLDPMISGKIRKMSGVEVKVTDDCIGCGDCVETCFVDAVSIEDGKAEINEDCRGCGRCVEVCSREAIKLELNDPKYFDRSIDQIKKLVDIK